jgi:hypothetical protein
MRINKEYFLPLVKEFCQTANEIGQAGYPVSGLFVPYTFEKYATAPKKIFYVGRDTAGWVKFDEMMQDFQSGNLSNYLDKNSNVVTVLGKNQDETDEHSLKENWNTTNKWNFWTYCQKLHLYITKGYTEVDITKLDDEDYQIIEQMGYGNLNSIEHDNSQKNMGIWGKIVDKSKFHQLRLASRKFDRLKHILDAYAPDLIIILNWENRDDVFEGLKFEWHKDSYIEGLRAMYTIEGYDTKILWSNHPNARSISVYDRIKIIGDTAKELLGI